MIEIGLVLMLLVGGFLGLAITRAFVSQRHWRQVVADGDLHALNATLLEALEIWRRLRPPQNVVPSDWRALQSAEVVAADTDRCRVSLIAEPDVRVVDGARVEAGPALSVARRSAVTMVERLLYEVPLARFDAVQVDVYAEYRSPDGHVESDCLLTTQVSRAEATGSDWDEAEASAILENWTTRELQPGTPLDPDEGALITAAEAYIPTEDAPQAGSNGTVPQDASQDATREAAP